MFNGALKAEGNGYQMDPTASKANLHSGETIKLLNQESLKLPDIQTSTIRSSDNFQFHKATGQRFRIIQYTDNQKYSNGYR